MNNFDSAFTIILGSEGGYVNDPRDSGGETKYGIAKKFYPNLDIKNLTVEQAKAIYKKDYWDKAGCDSMPYKMALVAFDCAVNQGVGIAIKLAQKSCNVDDDGIIGKGSLAAFAKATDDNATMFLTYRALRYVGTKGFDIYGKGWIKRLFHVSLVS
jgi:lysozyme family protein